MSAALGFGVLGPVEARRDDDLIDLGRPRQRAVLAILLLHADQVVPSDRLLALLGGKRASSCSSGAMQVYVSNLRRALEPERASRAPARVLVSQAGGYRLATGAAAIDAARFEAGTTAGIRLLAEARPAEARGALADALSLWRGPALADFATEDFAQLEVARLDKLRVVAREAQLEADLALGAHASAVPDLEQLVAENPLRERLWQSLMLALYRSGRQADALRAFQRCRSLLATELGIDPGPELRDLEAAVLAQDPALDWRIPPSMSGRHRSRPAARDMAPKGPSVLIGRADQLSRLEAAWTKFLGSDRSGFILISGEAGIGKTRLAEELASIAAADGARVLWGRCYEAEAPPFWPWGQAMEALLADLAPGAAGQALDDVGLDPTDLAAVVGATGADGERSAPVSPAPADARFRLNRAVAAVVREAASNRPVALFLDDLQWADDASLKLLAFLANDLGDLPVVIVLTYRQAEARDHPLLLDTLGELARHSVLERVGLTGLHPADVAQFIASITGGAVVSPTLPTALHRRTEGNPFFMSEVVRLLVSEGALADADAAQHSQVPVGVRDVTRRRLAHLPESAQLLLDLAAVAGHEFELGVLAAAQATDETLAFEALEPALVNGVVVEVNELLGRYRFSHALVREAIYDDLSRLQRARLHARLGEALELRYGRNAEPEALARHFLLSHQVVGAERCIPYLLDAADVAMNRLAYERAAQHLRTVLDLLVSTPSSAERDHRELWVQTRLGLVLGATVGHAAPELASVFARSRALCATRRDDPVELATVFGFFLFAWMTADHVAAHGHADELFDLAARTQDPKHLLGGHLAKGLVLFDQAELAAAQRHFQQVAVLADSLQDPRLASVLHADPRVSSRFLLAQVLALAGGVDQARRLASEGLALARNIGHPYSEATALTSAAFCEVLCHRSAAAQDLAETAIDYCSARGYSSLAFSASGLLGWAMAVRGDVAAGLPLLRRNLVEAETCTPARVRHFHLALAADVERRAGLLDEALATVAEGLADVQGSCFYEAELHRIRGVTLRAAAVTLAGEAEESLRRAAEVARRQGAQLLVQRAEGELASLLRRARIPATSSRQSPGPVTIV